MKEVTVTARTATRTATRGVLYVHSAPSALCPHIEWAVGGVLGVAVEPGRGPRSPPRPGTYRAELSWAGDAGIRGRRRVRAARLEPPALRDHRGADPGHRGCALLLHPRARRLPRRHRPARRHHDPRGPAQGGRGQGRARATPRCWARSTSCSASPGTTSSSPSGTPARAPRSAGCTRWSSAVHGRAQPGRLRAGCCRARPRRRRGWTASSIARARR